LKRKNAEVGDPQTVLGHRGEKQKNSAPVPKKRHPADRMPSKKNAPRRPCPRHREKVNQKKKGTITDKKNKSRPEQDLL